MKQINEFNIARLRTDEDFGFHKRVENLAKECLTGETNQAVVAAYSAGVLAFDNALKQETKNSQTALLTEADAVADKRWVNLCAYGRALPGHPTAEKAAIGAKIAHVISKYGSIAGLSYDEEYSLMYNAIQEFRAVGDDNLEAVDFTVWLDALEAAYTEFMNIRSAKVSEDAARTTGIVKTTRTAADAAYKELVKKVNALCIVLGEAGYANFIDRLNVMIADMKALLKARGSKPGTGGGTSGGGSSSGGGTGDDGSGEGLLPDGGSTDGGGGDEEPPTDDGPTTDNGGTTGGGGTDTTPDGGSDPEPEPGINDDGGADFN